MNGGAGARTRPDPGQTQTQVPADRQVADTVFRTSPRQLQQYLAAKYAPALRDEVEDIEEDLEETELDDYDEEGWPEDGDPHEGILEQPMGPSPLPVEEPAYDRSDFYLIAVDEDDGGVYSCASLEHSWMAGNYPDEAFFLSSLAAFLGETAAWLEKYKQCFLGSPSPASFLEGEKLEDLENNPIVTQKGLLERINHDQKTVFDLTRFTSIVDFLALDFDGQFCLFKEALFSEEARKAAAVKLFKMKYPNRKLFRELPATLSDEDKRRLERLTGRNLSDLDNDEKRIVLRDELRRYLGTEKLKLNVNNCWTEIIQQLAGETE
ncbi:MAG TPA: hypothetical protein PLD73_07755 [Candidatus Hydrogenedentes bacterium]|jgi:hypothetical protein|nr:hypothetical protein [Candidatus Hydrogenedentota bacterium]